MNIEVNMDTVLPQERRQRILERLAQDGKVVAAELGATFGVSEDTIRRDLRELAQAGLLQRVHGGALPRSPSTAAFAVRRQQVLPARTAVAKRAASLLRHGQVVLIDGGATTLEIARHLPQGLRITALTTSPAVALALAEHGGVDIILIGGTLDKQAMVVTGAATLESLRSVRTDVCFLGVCSIHPEVGITTTNHEEAHLKRAMIANAADVIATVTAEKLGTAAPYVVAPITDLTHIVTEATISNDMLAPYAQAGITVVRA
jgi:DeoR/GlpR family transcriptional regulator of sugar metabolism